MSSVLDCGGGRYEIRGAGGRLGLAIYFCAGGADNLDARGVSEGELESVLRLRAKSVAAGLSEVLAIQKESARVAAKEVVEEDVTLRVKSKGRRNA